MQEKLASWSSWITPLDRWRNQWICGQHGAYSWAGYVLQGGLWEGCQGIQVPHWLEPRNCHPSSAREVSLANTIAVNISYSLRIFISIVELWMIECGFCCRLYPAMEALTEPHRLQACLFCTRHCIAGMLVNHDRFPEIRTHVLPLLNLCLPCIDSNDLNKSMVSFWPQWSNLTPDSRSS